MLQSTSCTEVSFLTSSIWVEASDISVAFSVEILVLIVRRVTTILAEHFSVLWAYKEGAGPSLCTLLCRLLCHILVACAPHSPLNLLQLLLAMSKPGQPCCWLLSGLLAFAQALLALGTPDPP